MADLNGTGFTLCCLIEQAAGPRTEVLMLNRFDAPGYTSRYERYAGLRVAIDLGKVHEVISRPNNGVLEFMNRAPHAQVIDVQQAPTGFRPVFVPIEYPPRIADVIAGHHAAFDAATALLDRLTDADLAAMRERNAVPLIIELHGRTERSPDFTGLSEHAAAEERALWQLLDEEAARRRPMTPATEARRGGSAEK